MLSFSISYWDLIKFPYFADTSERWDGGGESRPKDKVTLQIALSSHLKFTLKIHLFSLDFFLRVWISVVPVLDSVRNLEFWVYFCFGKKKSFDIILKINFLGGLCNTFSLEDFQKQSEPNLVKFFLHYSQLKPKTNVHYLLVLFNIQTKPKPKYSTVLITCNQLNLRICLENRALFFQTFKSLHISKYKTWTFRKAWFRSKS
jgi:hypothetical protein